MPDTMKERALSAAQIEQFITQGFVRIDEAFPRPLAEEARAILWRDTACDPDDPTTWTKPVIRLGDYSQEPFRRAANTAILHRAFDQLVGAGRWLPRGVFALDGSQDESPVERAIRQALYPSAGA